MYNKKTISPVVATALLLVVAVVAVVGFQSWFQLFSSNLFSDTETKSFTNLGNTQIEDMIGNSLYFKNGNTNNITITAIKIEGIDCNISTNLTVGINELDISTCTENLSLSNTEVVVYTNIGIYSEEFYYMPNPPQPCILNDTLVLSGDSYSFYNSSTVVFGSSCSSQIRTCTNGNFDGDSIYSNLNCSVLPLDCSTLGLAGGSWITVPGNTECGASDFCVMKFEAKNVGGVATSQEALTPWVSINQINSRNNCSALGSKYHSITNAEWMSIARNAEVLSVNWNSSIVGTGLMFSGHGDGTPASALNISNVSNYYDQTSNVAPSSQKRVLILNNSEVIWDLSGNVWEWNNNTCTQGDPWYSTAGWLEWTNSNINGTEKTLAGPFGNYVSGNGAGYYYGCTSNGNGFLRGNAFNFGIAGVYSISLFNGPSAVDAYWGYRCVYTP